MSADLVAQRYSTLSSAATAVDAARHGRIESLLFAAATKWPCKTALVDGNETVPYETLAGRAAGMAAKLARSGVSRGDRVAIFLDKTAEAVATLFGAWAGGSVAVPVNEGLKSRQVAHVLKDSGASLLVSTPHKLSRLEPESYKDVPVIEPGLNAGSWPPDPIPDDGKASEEPALLLYTSGSTGRAKGILISHGNLIAVYPQSPLSDDFEFVKLLTQRGLLALPAHLFHHKAHFRLSLTAPDAQIERALVILKDAREAVVRSLAGTGRLPRLGKRHEREWFRHGTRTTTVRNCC